MEAFSEAPPPSEAVPTSEDILSAMSSLGFRDELLEKINSAFSEISRLQNEQPQADETKKVGKEASRREINDHWGPCDQFHRALCRLKRLKNLVVFSHLTERRPWRGRLKASRTD